jgi:hypothetical protein
MLHFIIGLAVCIWIAERVTHYWIWWRENRELTRALRTPKAPSEPSGWLFPVCVCLVMGLPIAYAAIGTLMR